MFSFCVNYFTKKISLSSSRNSLFYVLRKQTEHVLEQSGSSYRMDTYPC